MNNGKPWVKQDNGDGTWTAVDAEWDARVQAQQEHEYKHRNTRGGVPPRAEDRVTNVPPPVTRHPRFARAESASIRYDFDVVTITAEGKELRLSEDAARQVLAALAEAFEE